MNPLIESHERSSRARDSTCPLHYHYTPAAMRIEPSLEADTVYVIGGLYGNVEALEAIFALRAAEARAGRRVDLVFNGDFNWFNIDPASFSAINAAVLEHCCIQGNVEAEIGNPSANGCGCNYPAQISDAFVARSDAIMACLQATSARFPDIRAALARLPMMRVVRVGAMRIGILHGDSDSLAGWRFAAERLRAAAQADPCAAATPAGEDRDAIARAFRAAEVSAFACTHTCLPYAGEFVSAGTRGLVINNGSAGMANFRGTTHGLITRICADRRVPGESVYGVEIDGVRFDAVPVRFDQRAWLDRFLANWPAGTPAHASYFERIVHGPDFDAHDAIGAGIERAPR